MKTTFVDRFSKSLAAAVLFLAWAGIAHGAVTFTITPSVVSNTFIGPITLLISNLPTGDTVVIQKFAIAASNGVVAAGDELAQQFDLTDNQAPVVVGGVTNINVPFDYNSTTGAIAATVPFPGGDFSQEIVGQYGFVLSSPVGHFPALTNLFTVTNFPFAQQIKGSVTNNSGSAVPYAGIIIFPAPRAGHDLGNPVAGTVANGSGAYSIPLPPGAYLPLAFKSNYVANYTTSPVVTLTNAQTVTTNLALTTATTTISGKVVDAVSSNIGLPGFFVPANGTNLAGNNLIAVGNSDTNGNFTIGVTSGSWKLSGDPKGLLLHGYLAYDSGTNLNAGTTGFVGGFYKATALFYGTVKDTLGNPLPGVAIEAYDHDNNVFDTDGYTDQNGNYVAVAYGGLGSSDPWVEDVDNSSSFPNYVFSQPPASQNGGTNLAVGSAVLQNLIALLATNQITGNVQYIGTNLTGVGVSAYATFGTNNFNVNTVDTDSNGDYTLTVGNGIWNVSVYDCGCSDGDSLNNVVSGLNYQDPPADNVTISNHNGVANFNVPSGSSGCSGVQIFTTSLPTAQLGYYYDNYLNGSTCNGNPNWTLNDPADFPTNLYLSSYGEIFGTPTTLGTYNFNVQLSDGAGNATNAEISLTITTNSAPLQILFNSLPPGTNGDFYFQTLQVTNGTPPYAWSIPAYSQPLPLNLMLDNSGDISGVPATSFGPHYFDVVVTDALTNSVEMDGLSVDIIDPALAPLVITNVALPNGTAGQSYAVQLGAIGGQSPYSWSVAPGSINPPAGLTLSPGGLISGTPAAAGSTAFKVQATDQYHDVAGQVYSLNVSAQVSRPVLGPVQWKPGQFGMFLTGQSNQNYTIQAATALNPPNWVTLFVTNNPAANAYVVKDPNATNNNRYYRAVVGP